MAVNPGTATIVINSTVTASTYSNSYTAAGGGSYLLVSLSGQKSANTPAPSAVPLGVTYGGVALTLLVESNNTTAPDWTALYGLQGPAPGAATLQVSGLSFRCFSAVVREVTRHDAVAQVVGQGSGGGSTGSTATSFTRTPLAAGNGLFSSFSWSNGDTTGTLAGSGGITPEAVNATGSVPTSDHTFAVGSEIVPDTAANGHGYTYTAFRSRLAWVEIAAGAATLDYVATPADLTLAGVTADWSYGLSDYVATPADLTLAGVTAAWSLGVIQPLSITAMPCDGYVFDSADGATAQITISGLGTSGDSIQVRGASAGGNFAWRTTTVDGAGNWSLTFFELLTTTDGNWYTPEARIGTDDLTKVTSANLFGSGHVVGIKGQSELDYTLNPAGFYSGITYPAVSAENMTVATQTASGTAITKRRITEATKTLTNVAMIALANALHKARPGRKFMVLDLAEPGTSRAGLMSDSDDAGGGRKWSDFADMVAFARSGGSDIGHVVECWYNSDAATLATFAAEWMPYYIGQRNGGGAFTLGTVNPDSTRNPTMAVDHCLWDITAAPGALGRGIFARSRTKYHMLTPMPFADTSTGVEQVNFTGTGRSLQLDRPARDSVKAFFDDSRIQTFAGGWGPSMHVVDFKGGPHPDEADPWGICQMGRNYLPAFLRASGYTIGEPVIIGTTTASDGSYADVTIDLPNGGNLTTLRILNSLAAPAVPPPHHQPVVGFEIRRSGDTDAQRRPVFKTTETTYPAAYRGTVTIIDAGTGTAPNRRGRIRITPVTPFATTGDALEFLRGEANAAILDPRDSDAELYKDMPIEHVPALYDATTLYPYMGVPVRPQPVLMTLVAGNDYVAMPADLTLAGVTAAWSFGIPNYVATPADLTLSGVVADWSLGIPTYVAVPADLTLSGVVASWSIGGAGPLIGSFGARPVGGSIIGGSIG